MLSEANILEIRIKMEALICERVAMVAMNAERQYEEYAIAYDSDAFFKLESKFEELAGTLIRLMES
jgi:hypothetical protein